MMIYSVSQVDNVAPVCDEDLQRYLESAKTEESLRSCPLLSLTDGYAFDLYQGTYCILTNKVLIRKQKEDTYMKEYPEFIKIANKYTAEAWEHLYFTTHSSYGRVPCKIEPNEKVGKVAQKIILYPHHYILKKKIIVKSVKLWKIRIYFIWVKL